MIKNPPKVITIPAKPEVSKQREVHRQLRVAAYCRVSTDEEEQLSSYEAQQTYYTDKIMTNPNWTMAGIFADGGITGTSARKRPEFLKMIRLCRQKKIDVVLTKSISRFARNTVDCLNYIRVLKELGIAVIFEKENINTLETDSEILITMLGAFAQSESESISANVRWGIRQAMREGKANIRYKWLYAYQRGEDGKPQIIPDQAKVVQSIYDQYLTGASLRMIKEHLENREVPNAQGEPIWSISNIRSILTNEKYCGDALLQKTFTTDCISRKVVKNTGQLPMYLVQNHHEGIVNRKTFDAVQAEMARRNAGKSPSKKNAATVNSAMSQKSTLIRQITGAMELELAPIPGESISLADIERRLEEIGIETRTIVARAAQAGDSTDYTIRLKAIVDEAAALKEKRASIEEHRKNNTDALRRIENAMTTMKQAPAEITQWDEPLIRQLVDTVKVLSADKIMVYLRGNIQIEQNISCYRR
jgi:DNA invertase Pin-like site-specific DNA recombinase